MELENKLLERIFELQQDKTEQNKEFLRGYIAALKWVSSILNSNGEME